MSQQQSASPVEVVVNVNPVFGEWFEAEISPEMIQGKLMWITKQIRTVRQELVTADAAAMEARYAYEETYDKMIEEALAAGAKSQAEADRTAKRLARPQRRVKDEADLRVKGLRDELEELYRAQLPATQSMNRIVMGEWQAEWAAAGHQGA